MIRIRLAKIARDVWGNRLRSILIVISIAVGLVALGTIAGTRAILSIEMERSFAAIRPSSGVVRTVQPFDDNFLASVRRIEGVSDADARRVVPAQVEVTPGDWRNLIIFAISDFDAVRVNKVHPQEGEWPPSARRLLIERAALPLLQVNIGDQLSIKTAEGKIRQMRVAGSAHDPAQLPANIDGTPYAYISFETLEWLGEPYGYNELYVIADRPLDAEYAQEVVNRVKAKAEDTGYTIPMTLTAEPGQLPLDDVLQSVLLLMGVMGLLSLFLSCFLIVNTVTAQLAQQRRQIGVMKALGATSSQVMWMYLLVVLAYGGAALALSAPVSRAASQALSQFLASLFNFDLASVEPPKTAFWLQAIVGLLIPALASLWPLLGSVGISAAEAMSSYTGVRDRSDKGWINRLIAGRNLWFARQIPVRSLLLSLRNTFRSRGRLVLTLATLILASAMFVSIFSLQTSMQATLNDMMAWMHFDLIVSFDRPYRIEKMQQAAKETPGVESVDGWIMLPVRRVRDDGSESKTFILYAPREGSDLVSAPEIVLGRWLEPEDDNAIVVSALTTKEEPDLQVGSEMRLKLDGKEHVFRIVGITQGMPFVPNVYANYQYVAEQSSRTGQADTALVRLSTAEGNVTDGLQAKLEKRYDQLGMNVNSIQTMSEERAEAAAFFSIIISLLLVMAITMAVVGGFGLMGTMSISVLERTREIGVLRAIGASNLRVAQVFILEGLAIGWISWFLGSLLAYPLSQVLSQVVGVSLLGLPLSFAYSLSGVWTWLAVVTLLGALASLLPARNATRLTVREILAYE